MWNDVLLHIAKLLDQPVTSGRATLTILALPKLTPPAIRPEITKAIEQLKEDARFARDWRHRRLAHLDLLDALGRSATPLAGASRAMVQTALDHLATILNLIDAHFCDATFAYSSFGAADAVGLLLTIRRGHRAYEESNQRRLRGDYTGDDWKEDPI